MEKPTGLLNQEKESEVAGGMLSPVNPLFESQEQDREQMDNDFFSSLLSSDEEKVEQTDIPLGEQNQERAKLLQAGFTNDEIDKEFGVSKQEKIQTPEEKLIYGIGSLDNITSAIDQSVKFLSITAPQVASSFATGSTAWLVGKVSGALVGLSAGITEGDFEKGAEEGRKIEDLITEKFTYAPTDERARDTVETLGYVLDHINQFSKGVGETIEYGIKDAAQKDTSGMMKALRLPQLTPWIRYLSEFGTELAIFKGIHIAGKKAVGTIGKGLEKLEGKPKETAKGEVSIPEGTRKELSAKLREKFKEKEETPKAPADFVDEVTSKEKAEIIYDNILKDISPEKAITIDTIKKQQEAMPEAKPEEFFSKVVEHETQKTPIEKPKEVIGDETLNAQGQRTQGNVKEIEGLQKEVKEVIPTPEQPVQKVKIGKSPQTHTVLEELKATPEETALGEKYYSVKNDKTGEVMTVESKDMKAVKKRLISDETAVKANKRVKEKLGGIHSGVDPTVIADAAILGAYHLESGIRTFAEWSVKMVEDVGEGAKPYLKEIWDKTNEKLKSAMVRQTEDNLRVEMEAVPQKRQKQFLQTAHESPRVSPEIKAKLKELEQEYTIKPNPESIAQANEKINKIGESEAIKYIEESTEYNDIKSGMFEVLIEKLQSKGEYDTAARLFDSFDQQSRNAGRGIQMLARWNLLKPEGFLKWTTKQIEKLNNNKGLLDSIFKGKKIELTSEQKAEILKRKNEINQLPDGVEKTNATLALIDDIAKMIPPTISELIDAYRYQNMLSGWQTQSRNIHGGMFNVFVTRPLDIGARGALDYFESTLFSKERQAYVKDVPEYYKKAINAVPNAIDSFMDAWKFKSAIEKPDLGLDVQGAFKQARTKHLPKYLTVIQRFMEASDKFNLALIKAGDYAVQLQRGLTPEKAMAEAELNAQKYLYRSEIKLNDTSLSVPSEILADLNHIISRSESLPVVSKPIRWAIPFLRTPMNVGIQMIEHSPLALIRRNGFTQEARAKIMAGSIITAVGTYMAMQDKVTWTAPTGEKEKQMFYAAGKKPFSVDINGVQVPVWYFGPYALAFMIPAAVKHHYKDKSDSLTTSQIEKLASIAGGVARFIGSQSSAQSIGNFFNWISGDIDYNFSSQMGFTAEQVLPLSGLLRNTSKILDPVYRDPEGFWESIQKDIPLLSDDIPAHTTPVGEESERQWWNGLMPYEVGIEDALYDALLEDMNKAAKVRQLNNDFKKKLKRYKDISDKDIEKFLEKLGESYNE